MFYSALLCSGIASRARTLLEFDRYDAIGTYKCPDGNYHVFDKDETKKVLQIYIAHFEKIANVLSTLGISRWKTEEARQDWIRWIDYVVDTELPFVIPRMRLYNKDDPKRLREIFKFVADEE